MRFLTLLSDFGHKDASTAIARSILLRHNPDAAVLEISASVTGENLIEAAYLSASSYKEFPEGTCHIIYVGIYHSRNPSLVLCEKDGHYFLAPNNGILPLALGIENISLWQCYEWDREDQNFRDWQEKCAEIAYILSHKKPADLGFPHFKLDPIKQMTMPLPVATEHSVDCQILHIAHNGNLIINMRKEDFEALRRNRGFKIDLGGIGNIGVITPHAGMVSEGEALCRFNRAGYMEIAVKGASAAKLLSFNLYDTKQKYYRHLKISFE
ncbi:MAG: SAM-dependent chlorinase/fluorinase [Chitinophagaceae bacterium]